MKKIITIKLSNYIELTIDDHSFTDRYLHCYIPFVGTDEISTIDVDVPRIELINVLAQKESKIYNYTRIARNGFKLRFCAILDALTIQLLNENDKILGEATIDKNYFLKLLQLKRDKQIECLAVMYKEEKVDNKEISEYEYYESESIYYSLNDLFNKIKLLFKRQS